MIARPLAGMEAGSRAWAGRDAGLSLAGGLPKGEAPAKAGADVGRNACFELLLGCGGACKRHDKHASRLA
jgi:hypothetical protein